MLSLILSEPARNVSSPVFCPPRKQVSPRQVRAHLYEVSSGGLRKSSWITALEDWVLTPLRYSVNKHCGFVFGVETHFQAVQRLDSDK